MILFFTGTGNSEYAARRIGRITGETPVSLVNRIRSGDTSPLESETPWVICAPIYAWQMPRIVRDHIAATELRGSRDVYFVLTCGGDTGNADKYARKLCESKGLRFRGMAKAVMPENYIAMFSAPDEEEARRIIEKAVPGIDGAAELIKEGRDLPPVKKGVLAGFLSAAVNRGFYASAIKDRDFFATDACISCGLCAEVCPLGNIELRDGRPVWKGTCTQCMSCICRCPVKAIEFGKKSTGKPRYICPDV
jgi:ferredoxin